MDRHGDSVTPCHHGPPASSGDMGTRDGHEDSLTSCPQGSPWDTEGRGDITDLRPQGSSSVPKGCGDTERHGATRICVPKGS